MIDGYARGGGAVSRIERIVRASVPDGAPVYCGGIPGDAGAQNAARCIIVSQTGADKAPIEVRASDCARAYAVADALVDAAGILRAVTARHDSPGLGLGFARHVAVVAV